SKRRVVLTLSSSYRLLGKRRRTLDDLCQFAPEPSSAPALQDTRDARILLLMSMGRLRKGNAWTAVVSSSPPPRARSRPHRHARRRLFPRTRSPSSTRFRPAAPTIS